jgi:carbonic anhydrase
MSCPEATSPINIDTTLSNIEKCNLYCSYSFNYNDSTCIVKHYPTFLEIAYETNVSKSHVTLNNDEYNASTIRIYSPSIHTYNGVKADAEMIIIHHGFSRQKLIVSIPFVQTTNGSTGIGSNIMNDIIQQLSGVINTTVSNDTQILNVNNFNLNNFVPKTPYYFYVGKSFFSECDGTYYYIVFDKTSSAISMPYRIVQLLQQMITPANIPIQQNTFYLNDKGPNKNKGDLSDDIYIDCRPTGEDGKILYEENSATASNIANMGDEIPGKQLADQILNSPYAGLLIFIGVGVVLTIVGSKIFKKSTTQ